mmetsp:Transcript_66950/g.131812  ORF Transcript_66950/g.131812 Transcript_66950/m.131812 type:complete len:333 (-) Transcript_66950:24-1022(-)
MLEPVLQLPLYEEHKQADDVGCDPSNEAPFRTVVVLPLGLYGLVHLFLTLLGFLVNLLRVVIDAVQDRTLVDHHHGELAEDSVQLFDRGGDLRDLMAPLRREFLHILKLLQLLLRHNIFLLPGTTGNAGVAAFNVDTLLPPPLDLLHVVLLRVSALLRELLQLRRQAPLRVLPELVVQMRRRPAGAPAQTKRPHLMDALFADSDLRVDGSGDGVHFWVRRIAEDSIQEAALLGLGKVRELLADLFDVFLGLVGAIDPLRRQDGLLPSGGALGIAARRSIEQGLAAWVDQLVVVLAFTPRLCAQPSPCLGHVPGDWRRPRFDLRHGQRGMRQY